MHPTVRCAPAASVLQLYGDSDLLLGAYSVPLVYDEPLIQQVCFEDTLKVLFCQPTC